MRTFWIFLAAVSGNSLLVTILGKGLNPEASAVKLFMVLFVLCWIWQMILLCTGMCTNPIQLFKEMCRKPSD